MEPLIPTLDAPAHGVARFPRSAGLTAPGLVDRHRATVMTALMVILVFVVSIHFPDHGVPVHHLLRHPGR